MPVLYFALGMSAVLGALGMERLFNFTRNGVVIGYYLKASAQTFVEVFHADAVSPTERRWGTMTPCPPNARVARTASTG